MSVSMNQQMSPDRYWEDRYLDSDSEPDYESLLIVDDHHGIYIPQVFCQQYEKTDQVSQTDWNICLSGPDNELYWEAWESILDDWEAEETDESGKKYKIGIFQDGSLFQTRRLIETV